MKNDNHKWDNKHPTAQMLGRWQPWHAGLSKAPAVEPFAPGPANQHALLTVPLMYQRGVQRVGSGE